MQFGNPFPSGSDEPDADLTIQTRGPQESHDEFADRFASEMQEMIDNQVQWMIKQLRQDLDDNLGGALAEMGLGPINVTIDATSKVWFGE